MVYSNSKLPWNFIPRPAGTLKIGESVAPLKVQPIALVGPSSQLSYASDPIVASSKAQDTLFLSVHENEPTNHIASFLKKLSEEREDPVVLPQANPSAEELFASFENIYSAQAVPPQQQQQQEQETFEDLMVEDPEDEVEEVSEGDVIAYRLIELSSTWTPELSSFRVGRILWCDPRSTKIVLMPIPGYPIISEKKDEDASELQPDTSLYMEDGKLEIDFKLLIDVRVVKQGDLAPAKPVTDKWAQASSSESIFNYQPSATLYSEVQKGSTLS
ncbi:hypothetical protein LguiA_029275 [Lonicera macranthoides]